MTSTEWHATHQIVVMGVSGSGKSLLGSRLAAALGDAFGEGDDFHPPANISRMAAGIPLTDADRRPWLEAIGRWIATEAAAGRSTVVACSALARRHRDVLRRSSGLPLLFVHLDGDPDLIAARMRGREHFMPVRLLRSQVAALEPLGEDESGVRIGIGQTPEEELAEALAWLGPRLREEPRG